MVLCAVVSPQFLCLLCVGIVLEYLGLFLAWILLLVACFVFSLCVVVCVFVSRLVVRLSERAAVVGGLGFTNVCIGGAGIILVSDHSRLMLSPLLWSQATAAPATCVDSSRPGVFGWQQDVSRKRSKTLS